MEVDPFVYWLKFLMFSVAILILGLKIGIVLWWKPKKIEAHFAKQGIRGPPYQFFIGNVKEIVQFMLKASSQPLPNHSHNILPRVFSFYHHWKKIYGATFLVWFGPKARVTIADPDLIREIFTSNSEMYEKIEANPLVKQLEGGGLISLKGEKWAHHRKIITPTFHMENLKLLIPVVATSVTDMLDKWSLMSAGANEVQIEVSDWFQSLTDDVITRMAFGTSYEDGKAIFRLQSQQMVLIAQAFNKVLFPGYRFLPTKGNLKIQKLDKEIRKSLVQLIEKRMENSNIESTEESRPKDLLGLMIQAVTKEQETVSRHHHHNSQLHSSSIILPSRITVQDIVEECKSFFFAGKQTSSNLITWTTVLLAMHPHWQDLAREEVLRVCGSRDTPTKDDIVKLKMLSMIINETLRLYPAAIATIRRAKYDVELGSYKVPRGTELLVPILAVHHDKSIWGKNANEFNPMRFADGVSRAANHPIGFIPFGLGIRTCIGQNLAVLQAKLVCAILLQRFSFKLAPSYQHAPTVLMFLYPQHGAPIIFQRLPDDDVDHDQ